MKFLGILLISVLPLTLAELKALSSLPNFAFANETFNEIDQNQNDILELTECISSFDQFKETPTDSNIGRERFADLVASQNGTVAIGNKLFTNYDLDQDGDLDNSDFNAIYTLINNNSDDRVTREEFIRYYDELLTRIYN